jgi:hypothetical protein
VGRHGSGIDVYGYLAGAIDVRPAFVLMNANFQVGGVAVFANKMIDNVSAVHTKKN